MARIKFKWRHFWNVRFSKSVGRFLDHFARVRKLDESGKHKTFSRLLHRIGMQMEVYFATFCHLMCKLAGH